MPTLKVQIDDESKKKLKEIAKKAYGEDCDYTISLLLNRYLRGLN